MPCHKSFYFFRYLFRYLLTWTNRHEALQGCSLLYLYHIKLYFLNVFLVTKICESKPPCVICNQVSNSSERFSTVPVDFPSFLLMVFLALEYGSRCSAFHITEACNFLYYNVKSLISATREGM